MTTGAERVRKHRPNYVRTSAVNLNSGSLVGLLMEYAGLPRPEDAPHGKKSRRFSSNISLQTLLRPVLSRPLRRMSQHRRRIELVLSGNGKARARLSRVDSSHLYLKNSSRAG